MSQTPVTPGSARTTHPCRRPSSVIVEEYDTEEQYGFAFAADADADADEALVEAVNDALATLRDDGAYDDIYDSHFSAG